MQQEISKNLDKLRKKRGDTLTGFRLVHSHRDNTVSWYIDAGKRSQTVIDSLLLNTEETMNLDSFGKARMGLLTEERKKLVSEIFLENNYEIKTWEERGGWTWYIINRDNDTLSDRFNTISDQFKNIFKANKKGQY